MRSGTSTTRTLRFGLAAIATLAFSIGLASGSSSPAWAQNDDATGDVASAPAVADQSDQSAAGDSDHKADEATDAAKQAHDDADEAAEALETATSDRNQLEADGAPQDEIDAANQAIAQARAEKEAADEAAQRADEASGDAQSQ